MWHYLPVNLIVTYKTLHFYYIIYNPFSYQKKKKKIPRVSSNIHLLWIYRLWFTALTKELEAIISVWNSCVAGHSWPFRMAHCRKEFPGGKEHWIVLSTPIPNPTWQKIRSSTWPGSIFALGGKQLEAKWSTKFGAQEAPGYNFTACHSHPSRAWEDRVSSPSSVVE